MLLTLDTEKRIIKYSTWVVLFLFVYNIFDVWFNQPFWQLHRFLNVRAEANFPTWLSSVLLLLCGFYSYKCLFVNTIKEHKSSYAVLTVLFVLMSCDETAQIHEYVGMALNDRFFHLEGMYSSWVVIIGPPILVVLAILFIKVSKVFAGSRKVKLLLVSGFFVYLYGAFASEIIGNVFWGTTASTLKFFMSVFKEICEMMGLILLLKGFMLHRNLLEGKE